MLRLTRAGNAFILTPSCSTSLINMPRCSFTAGPGKPQRVVQSLFERKDASSQIILYFNPTCSKSKGALALLQQNLASPAQLTVREYITKPLDEQELRTLIKTLTSSNLKKFKPWQLVREGGNELTEAQVVSTLLSSPERLQRPIVENTVTGKALIARPPMLLVRILDLSDA
eukprot:g32892.t1